MTRPWRQWTAGQWAARAVVLLGPLLAVLARTGPLGAPPVWLVAVVLVLAGAWALLPESVLGAVTLLTVGFSWAADRDGTVPLAAVAAAAALLAAHLAALVIGYGPARLPVNPRVVRLWALRGAGVLIGAPLVWVLADGVGELPGSSSAWLVGMVVSISVVVVAAAATQAALPQGEDE